MDSPRIPLSSVANGSNSSSLSSLSSAKKLKKDSHTPRNPDKNDNGELFASNKRLITDRTSFHVKGKAASEDCRPKKSNQKHLSFPKSKIVADSLEKKEDSAHPIAIVYPDEKPLFEANPKLAGAYAKHFKVQIQEPQYDEKTRLQDPETVKSRAAELLHTVDQAKSDLVHKSLTSSYLLDFYSLGEVYEAAALWLGPGATTNPNTGQPPSEQKRPKKKETIYKTLIKGPQETARNEDKIELKLVFSADGLKCFRPPTYKKSHGGMFMANFETFSSAKRLIASSNIHINIKFSDGSINSISKDCIWPEFSPIESTVSTPK